MIKDGDFNQRLFDLGSARFGVSVVAGMPLPTTYKHFSKRTIRKLGRWMLDPPECLDNLHVTVFRSRSSPIETSISTSTIQRLSQELSSERPFTLTPLQLSLNNDGAIRLCFQKSPAAWLSCALHMLQEALPDSAFSVPVQPWLTVGTIATPSFEPFVFRALKTIELPEPWPVDILRLVRYKDLLFRSTCVLSEISLKGGDADVKAD